MRKNTKKTKIQGTYKDVKLQYHDPVKNETLVYHGTDVYQSSEGSGRTLEINQKADNLADAQKIAKKKLRKANSKEITASIRLMGDLRFLGGNNLTLSGFGLFSGKYSIEKATHTISNGYTTGLELKMGGESKQAAKTKKKSKQSRKKSSKTSSKGNLVYTGNDVYKRD